MADPLKRPLDVINACKPVEVFETGEVVVLGRTLEVSLKHKIEETIVQLSQPVDNLSALVNNVLVEVLRLTCQLNDD